MNFDWVDLPQFWYGFIKLDIMLGYVIWSSMLFLQQTLYEWFHAVNIISAISSFICVCWISFCRPEIVDLGISLFISLLFNYFVQFYSY